SLKSVDAMKATFKGAYFADSNLDHGNFSGSDFTKALFIDTKFGDAIVENAVFERAEFTDSNLAKVIGLTQEQINTSCGNEKTELPTGLTLMNCEDLPDEENAEENTFLGFSMPATSPFAIKSARAPSFGRAYQSAGRSDIRILITDNDQQHPILQKLRAKRVEKKEALDDALKGIDSALRDLPIDSPTRAKLMQSREILQNIKDTE
ncbi:MAG TPA: pentapeptide repeat-containing protein, partial [Hellea balneolensis]|nr:pentapeptide repeat-containing protein [Hellea balneolensis]